MRLLLAFLCLSLGAGSWAAEPARAAAKQAPSKKRSRPRPRPTPERLPPETMEAPTREGEPYLLRWMLHPIKRGMFIGLPVMDTDPNRGITVGIMPIWVLRETGGDRITEIYAPSLTYNNNFEVTPTFRYYGYPSEDATWVARGSVAKYEREAMLEYENQRLMDYNSDLWVRVQFNVDASRRFFGIGPDTPHEVEANYKESFLLYRVGSGVPLFPGSKWNFQLANHFKAQKVDDGPLKGLRGFRSSYPQFAGEHTHQTNEIRYGLGYDNRDHAVTTTQGAYFQTFSEHAIRGFASEYDYNRYAVDARYFFKWPLSFDTVSAGQFKFEQIFGITPFWQMPDLGGKYNLRAYGEGRYIDNGLILASLEQRVTVYKVKTAGVTTELEIAPFAGFGSVYDRPKRLARRYIRPVIGSAIRAVARPQVVGSVDFGLGQEGLAAFMDINYSF
ncbi:MAG: BamA/TamA family outer membrane protein [Elusimicrobia bacterium]|nr:BamA/TamA family outer membrane protein [Elusimicrobiota bacterium]